MSDSGSPNFIDGEEQQNKFSGGQKDFTDRLQRKDSSRSTMTQNTAETRTNR